MADFIYKGDTGKVIKVRVFEDTDSSDLSTATNLELSVKKNDGNIVTWVGVADTTDKFIEYTLVTGDINQAGTYTLHAEFDDGGNHFIGNKECFVAYEKYTGPK